MEVSGFSFTQPVSKPGSNEDSTLRGPAFQKREEEDAIKSLNERPSGLSTQESNRNDFNKRPVDKAFGVSEDVSDRGEEERVAKKEEEERLAEARRKKKEEEETRDLDDRFQAFLKAESLDSAKQESGGSVDVFA